MTDVSTLDGEPDAAGGEPAAKGSFYRALVGDFLVAQPSTIIGQLSSRHFAYHASAEREQVRAWEAEIALLKTSLAGCGECARDWWLLLETPLLRLLGKRLDAVILVPGVVVLIEFKMGAARFDAQAMRCRASYQSAIHFHPISVGSAVGRRSEAERPGSGAHITHIPLVMLMKVVIRPLHSHCWKTRHIADSPPNSVESHDRSVPQCAAYYLTASRREPTSPHNLRRPRWT